MISLSLIVPLRYNMKGLEAEAQEAAKKKSGIGAFIANVTGGAAARSEATMKWLDMLHVKMIAHKGWGHGF